MAASDATVISGAPPLAEEPHVGAIVSAAIYGDLDNGTLVELLCDRDRQVRKMQQTTYTLKRQLVSAAQAQRLGRVDEASAEDSQR